jgi:hypothetical protein
MRFKNKNTDDCNGHWEAMGMREAFVDRPQTASTPRDLKTS